MGRWEELTVLVAVLMVVVGLVVLGAVAAWAAARARRFGRARARLAGAVAAGLAALPAVHRPVNAAGTADATEPDAPLAR